MDGADTPQDRFSWRVHPARDRPGMTVVVLLIVTALTVLVVELMHSVWWGLLPIVFFLVTLQRYLLPSDYRVDEEGVTAESAFATTKLHWPEIRRFTHDERGGFLSRRRKGSLLDAFQGLHLQFGGNREEVIARIRSGMPKKGTA